jgi:hypothetical protein
MSLPTGLAVESLDRGAILVRRLPGWVGVLWLAALPGRLLMAYLLDEVLRLGANVRQHGDALASLALLAVVAWVVSLLGRVFFVRACRIVHDSAAPSLGTVMRAVPGRDLLAVCYLALLLEVCFWLLLPIWVFAPFIALYGMASVVVAPLRGCAPFAPLRALGDVEPWALVRVGCALALAAVVVFANAYLVVQGLLWACSGVAGCDLSRWEPLLRFDNRLYMLLLTAGVLSLVEPFAIASITVLAILSQARRTGDDLREWFAVLRAKAGP